MNTEETGSLGDRRTLAAYGAAAPGATLAAGEAFGAYRVIRLIGRGGMGEVYEVEHTALGKRYALKLITPEFALQGDAVRRFADEARVMAGLNHPRIVRVDDSGMTDGRHWLRMELMKQVELNGCTIRNLDDLAKDADGVLRPVRQILMLATLENILEAIQYAHRCGVVHRDLKPSNILISEVSVNGEESVAEIKICDFGLALLVGEEWVRTQAVQSVRRSMSLGDHATITPTAEGASTLALLGTYEYMSPEQKRGEAVDHRTDIYSMGLVAYRLLTGGQLSPGALGRLPPQLVPAWRGFLSRALCEKPADRYRDVSEMQQGLRSVEAEMVRAGHMASGAKVV